MGGSNYVAKNPTTPGSIKRNVGIILKKVLAGPIGPITKKVGKKTVNTFGGPTKKTLAQPIASAFAGGAAVREVGRIRKALAGSAVNVPPVRIRKPRPTPPVISKKVIAAKKVA